MPVRSRPCSPLVPCASPAHSGWPTCRGAPSGCARSFIPVADTPGLRGLTSCTTRSTTARAGGGNSSNQPGKIFPLDQPEESQREKRIPCRNHPYNRRRPLRGCGDRNKDVQRHEEVRRYEWRNLPHVGRKHRVIWKPDIQTKVNSATTAPGRLVGSTTLRA